MIPGIVAGSFTHAVPPGGALVGAGIEVRSLDFMRRAFETGQDFAGGADTRLSRPDEQSAWVFAAIQLITGQINAVPLRWKDSAEAADFLPEDAQRAVFWEKPAAIRVGDDHLVHYLDDVVSLAGTWIKLRGVAHIILDDTWLTTRAAYRSRFFIARPDSLRPIEAGRGGEVLGWELRDAYGKRTMLLPEQVVTVRVPSPWHDLGGLSAYEAARTAAESDAAAGRYSRNVSASNGQAGEYITTDGPAPTPEQERSIIAALREKKRRVAAGDFAPVFLAGGLKVEDPKARAMDAAFTTQRIQNRHEIFAAMGIPMGMAEVTTNYSLGADSDMRRLVFATCAPLAAKLARAFSHIETLRSGAPRLAVFDWRQHPVSEAVLIQKFTSIAPLADRGVPMHNINQLLGLGLDRFPGDDVGFIPFGVQPIADALAPADKPQTPPADEPPPMLEEKFASVLALRDAKRAKAREIEVSHEGTEGTKKTLPALKRTGLSSVLSVSPCEAKASEKSRARLWNAHSRKRAPFERKLKGSLAKVFGRARAEVLANLDKFAALFTNAMDAAMPVKTLLSAVELGTIKAGGFESVLDLAKLQAEMWKAAKPAISLAMEAAGKELLAEVGSDEVFSLAPKAAKAFLDVRENRIKDAGKDVFDKITGTLKEGFDAGETMAQLTARVKEAFAGISDSRAGTIAATETGTAYNAARALAMEQTGATHKEWLSARDGRVRDTHAAADGQIVPVDEDFEMSDGTRMAMPCDPNAPAEHVINCRCLAIVALKDLIDPELQPDTEEQP